MDKAELELLALLMEECAEVIHVGGKIIRHGWDSYHPEDEEKTPNEELLRKEMGDVMAAYTFLCADRPELDLTDVDVAVRMDRKLKYLHHNTRESLSNGN